MDIPKDLQEKLEWMQKNRELQEEAHMKQMKIKEARDLARKKHEDNTMNYMGGGKYNKKNTKNF